MRGLISKSARESALLTVGLALGASFAMGSITFVVPQLASGLQEFMLAVPFIRGMVSAMMGVDIGPDLTITTMLSVLWTHPVVLALVSTHAIVSCARYPAGEIDRGTIDILLGWPVSRREVWRAHTLVWVLSGAIVVVAGLAGYGLATLSLAAEARPPAAGVLMAAVNLFALYLAVGAATLLASSLSSRQTHATAAGFLVVIGSFLLNFLVPYWNVADALSFLGLMEYYRPAVILRDGAFPTADVAVLVSIAIALWIAGMEITARRNVMTT
jgi:ABC-type transport system involved in multi-copper enzyme maturation permease subunit